jgi:hypothetical protein
VRAHYGGNPWHSAGGGNVAFATSLRHCATSPRARSSSSSSGQPGTVPQKRPPPMPAHLCLRGPRTPAFGSPLSCRCCLMQSRRLRQYLPHVDTVISEPRRVRGGRLDPQTSPGSSRARTALEDRGVTAPRPARSIDALSQESTPERGHQQRQARQSVCRVITVIERWRGFGVKVPTEEGQEAVNAAPPDRQRRQLPSGSRGVQ